MDVVKRAREYVERARDRDLSAQGWDGLEPSAIAEVDASDLQQRDSVRERLLAGTRQAVSGLAAVVPQGREVSVNGMTYTVTAGGPFPKKPCGSLVISGPSGHEDLLANPSDHALGRFGHDYLTIVRAFLRRAVTELDMNQADAADALFLALGEPPPTNQGWDLPKVPSFDVVLRQHAEELGEELRSVPRSGPPRWMMVKEGIVKPLAELIRVVPPRSPLGVALDRLDRMFSNPPLQDWAQEDWNDLCFHGIDRVIVAGLPPVSKAETLELQRLGDAILAALPPVAEPQPRDVERDRILDVDYAAPTEHLLATLAEVNQLIIDNSRNLEKAASMLLERLFQGAAVGVTVAVGRRLYEIEDCVHVRFLGVRDRWALRAPEPVVLASSSGPLCAPGDSLLRLVQDGPRLLAGMGASAPQLAGSLEEAVVRLEVDLGDRGQLG